MMKDNLVVLRHYHGYSQEYIAEKIGISRQAYAKWENGKTVPDIEKCILLSEFYGVTVDSLIKTQKLEGRIIPPSPKGKSIWGTVTINERGQLVIPKAARDVFGLSGGQRLVVLTDENEGLALVPVELFEKRIEALGRIAEIYK